MSSDSHVIPLRPAHLPTFSMSGIPLSPPGHCWDTLVKLVLASLMMLPWRRMWFFPPLEAPPPVRCPPLELAELLAESGVALRCPLRSLKVVRRSSEAQGTIGGRGPMVSPSPPDSLLPVVVDILLSSAATRKESVTHIQGLHAPADKGPWALTHLFVGPCTEALWWRTRPQTHSNTARRKRSC